MALNAGTTAAIVDILLEYGTKDYWDHVLGAIQGRVELNRSAAGAINSLMLELDERR